LDDGARRALDHFRLRRGLVRRDDLDAWLVSNAATAGWLTRTMRDEAAVTARLTPPPLGLDAAIVDHLRLTDRFAGLLRRALIKREKLEALGQPPAGPAVDAALGWYAEQSGRDAFAAAPGAWADAAAFRLAVWREYNFVHAAAQ
jgi:hypothetical protein